MLNAFSWGLVASSSLVVGGLLGSWVTISKRNLGAIMAFGAGALISAVAYELVLEAVKLAFGSGVTAVGFLVGAFTFFFADLLIGRLGGSERKAIGVAQQSSLAVPLVLAIILDGIPESVVIGLSILDGDAVSLNRTTEDWYTSSLAVESLPVRPERSAAKSKAGKPARSALFDFAAGAAQPVLSVLRLRRCAPTLRMTGSEGLRANGWCLLNLCCTVPKSCGLI
jgi:hypothetical protein